MITSLTCKHCKTEKSIDQFPKDASRSLGYKTTCKECRALGVNKRPKKIEGMKFCPKCSQYKKADSQNFMSYKNGRLYGYCRDCYKSWKKDWWDGLTPEQRKEKSAQPQDQRRRAAKRCYEKMKLDPIRLERTRQIARDGARRRYPQDKPKIMERAHKQRALRMGAPGVFSKHDLSSCFKRQNGECIYCGGKLRELERAYGSRFRWSVEHLIPLSRGGTNYPENIAVACQSCNSAKGDKMPWEFMPEKFPPPAESAD